MIASADPHPRPRVLIVDDDTDSAEVMCLSVAAFCEADAWAANDAVGAFELAGEIQPDVIILDIELPDVDGVELARRFRADERFKAAVLIAMTGYDQMRAACLEAGCDHFVLKPADPSVLRPLIARCETDWG